MDLKKCKWTSLCTWYVIFALFTHFFLHIEDRQNSPVFLANSPGNFSSIFKATGSHVCTVFRSFLLHALTYWAEILHMILFYFTTDQVSVLSILRQFFVGVMPLLELRILEIHSFPLFSLKCFDILSWNFTYDFVLLYYRSSSSVVNLLQFL